MFFKRDEGKTEPNLAIHLIDHDARTVFDRPFSRE
jgi:hypothetical protein